MDLLTYGYFLAVSFAITWLAMRMARQLATWWSLFDEPGDRKVHPNSMPLTGGVIFIGVFVAVLSIHSVLYALFFVGETWLPSPLQRFMNSMPMEVMRLVALIVAGLVIFALGLLDDKRHLKAGIRFIVQVIAVSLAILGGVQPMFTGIPYAVGAVLSIVWSLAIINAYNFVDGLDGLAAGLGIIALGLLIFLVGAQPQVIIVLCTLGGCLVGFFCHNVHPARVFMGSSGSMTLGYILGTITLYHGIARGIAVDVQAFFIPLLIMAMPLYDITSVTCMRIAKHVSIAKGDMNHFHHRLMRLGFSHRQAVVFIWLLALVTGLPTIVMLSLDRILSLVLMAQMFGMCLALIVIERAYLRLAHAVVPKTHNAPAMPVHHPTEVTPAQGMDSAPAQVPRARSRNRLTA